MTAPFDPFPDNLAGRRGVRDREHAEFMASVAEKQALRVQRKRLRASDVVVRAACSELLRAFSGAGGGRYLESADQVAERLYGQCEATTAYIGKAAANPAMTTVASWASELVTASVVDFLTDTPAPSAFAALASSGPLVVTERGLTTVPSRTHPVSPVGGWIGEGQPKPVYALSLASVNLSPYRLAALSFWSEELAERGALVIETVVRNSLAHDLRAVLDTSLLDSTATSSTRPAGLWNAATAVTPSTATPSYDAMTADIAALQTAVMTNAPDAMPVFVVNPKQAIRLTAVAKPTAAFGIDVIVSGYQAVGSVGCVDASALAMLVGDLVFTASNEATIVADTAPGALGIAGTPNVISAPAVSLFQQGCIALRSTLTASWAKRRSGCTALATGVSW